MILREELTVQLYTKAALCLLSQMSSQGKAATVWWISLAKGRGREEVV
jgi:hypothetical protein